MDLRTTVAFVAMWVAVLGLGCDDGGGEHVDAGGGVDARVDAAGDSGGDEVDGGGVDSGATDGGVDAGAPAATSVTIQVQPGSAAAGTERVNFGLPLALGALTDASLIIVRHEGSEVAASRRGLASWPDGSLRSVQLQIDLPAEATEVVVDIGTAPTAAPLSEVPVADTLADGEPRMWALIPASWLAGSGFAGPLVDDAAIAGTPLDAWGSVCDYDRHDTDAFLEGSASRGVWLFDRVTAMVRGYARSGERSPLRSAYREATLYREGLTGSPTDIRIGVPGASDDLKYHYTQGLALHYLLTGDDRFREAAEAVGARAASLWTSPGWAGGADFWTERHAGFGLLAYVWAAAVSDDRAGEFETLADDAVTAYLDIQATYPIGYEDADARCFAHHADAHGEDYGYVGCSPWMSAILADGLLAYAELRGGANADRAHASLIQLGRILARDGRDGSGKPFYFMGVGTADDEPDAYDEHWGESAYIVAMAWHLDGRRDAALRTAAEALLAGLSTNGSAPHVRSFNWQCRSAVMTPAFLR